MWSQGSYFRVLLAGLVWTDGRLEIEGKLITVVLRFLTCVTKLSVVMRANTERKKSTDNQNRKSNADHKSHVELLSGDFNGILSLKSPFALTQWK